MRMKKKKNNEMLIKNRRSLSLSFSSFFYSLIGFFSHVCHGFGYLSSFAWRVYSVFTLQELYTRLQKVSCYANIQLHGEHT